MVSLAALRSRFLQDVQGGGSAAPALAGALERIGWGAVQESSAEELASHVVYLVDACVHDHYDPALLAHEIAAMLRDHGPLLDGGLPPVDAYVPAAEELLRQYVSPMPQAGGGPFM
jgi:hypothetical protein